jgi:general secretion pathway protein A
MYNEYFGFTESPFNVTSDPRFFYSNRSYQETFTGLRWGIKLRRGLIVMTGETGTGKTTLLRMVREKFERSVHAALILNPISDFTQLLRLMSVDFGLTNRPDDRLAIMRELRGYLMEQFQENHIFSALFDEAQEFDLRTLKEIELLLNFETDNQKLLQVVLVGSPELETKFEQPELQSLKRRIALWCRLVPLTGQEVVSYIDHRVTRAGHQGRNLFAPDSVEQIALFSKGIPRLINIICDNALLAAYQAGKKDISPEIVQKVSHDLRLTKESEQISTIFSSAAGKISEPGHCSEPSNEDFKGPGPVADDQTAAGAGQAWSFEETPLGAQDEPKQISRFKTFRGSKILGVSTIVVLTAGAAVTYFDGRDVSGVKNDHTVNMRLETNEPAPEKSASEVFAGGLFDEISPIPAPTSRDLEQRTTPLLQRIVQEPQKNDQVGSKVYLHTSQPGDRLVLEEVGAALRVNGYTIPETRISTSRTQGDVRFFFSQDRVDAERVKSIVESELGRLGYRISLDVIERDGKQFQFAAPGKIEVWIPPLLKS